jgi:hypothetical protein
MNTPQTAGLPLKGTEGTTKRYLPDQSKARPFISGGTDRESAAYASMLPVTR